MKTKEELNALKEEVETVSGKLAELTEEEITQVCGGAENNSFNVCPRCGKAIICGEPHSCRRKPIVK